MPGRHITMGLHLALRDFCHEWRLSLCAVLGLAAVLAPLLVLYALKFGIVTSVRDQLAQDPRARELRLIGHGSFDTGFFDQIRAWPEVGFVLPSTRFLASTVQLRRSDGLPEPVTAEMWPSDVGDPALGGIEAPNGVRIVVSRSVADKLQLGKGDVVRAQVGRSIGDDRQAVRVTLPVVGVLAAAMTDRDVILVGLPLLTATEDWREGWAVPEYGWPGQAQAPTARSYASFRLFAKDIMSVEKLRDRLAAMKLDIQSRVGDIQLVRRLDDNLTFLFAVVASLGVTGCIVGIGMTQWASAERKRRDIAVLQLLGLTPEALAIFPLTQAALTAFLGALVALGTYAVIGPALNDRFASGFGELTVIARLDAVHVLIAIAATVAAAVVASLAAGFNVLRQQPSEGLRHD